MNLSSGALDLELRFRLHVVSAARELAVLQSTGRLLFPRRGQPVAALLRPRGAVLSTEQQLLWKSFRVPRARDAERWAGKGRQGDFVVGCLNHLPTLPIPTPADALRGLYRGLLPMRCECQTAMRLVGLRAILETFGEDAFHRLVRSRGPRLRVGGGHDPVVYNALSLQGDTGRLVPGDFVAFSNPGATDDSWRYENAVFLGQDPGREPVFFAHPFGIRPASEILGQLRRKRRSGSELPFLDTLIFPAFSYMESLGAPGLYERFDLEWRQRAQATSRSPRRRTTKS